MAGYSKVPYQDPSTISRNLASQEFTDANGDLIDVEVVSLAADFIHSGGPITNNTPGTPVALAGVTQCKHITIQASPPNYLGVGGNQGGVWVGGSGVNASSKIGIRLSPGDSYELDVDDLSKVFFDVEVTGDKISYNYTL